MKIKLAVVLFIFTISIGAIQYVYSFQDGITGFSGMNGPYCINCHNTGIIPEVVIEGPQVVAQSSTQTYRLIISGGQEISGGLDVAVTNGSLHSISSDTQFLGGEITHTAPKSVNQNGEVIFTYSWTAPAITDTVTMYGAGNSVNGDGSNFGDYPDVTTLTIEVLQLDEKVYFPAILRN